MKKALAILMVLALVASAVTAEVSIGAWGRGLFVPVSNSGASGEDSQATNKASWGGAPRIGFTIAGNSDNVGFQVDMNGDGGSINAGDQQKIWVKPVDMLKISLGRVQVDTLRGNAAFGSFNWDRAYGDSNYGEDFTFTRISTGTGDSATYDNKQGVVFEITPMDALFIGVAFRDVRGQNMSWDFPGEEEGETETVTNDTGSTLTENLFSTIQLAFGYTIEGTGQIRAQIIRNAAGWDVDGTAADNNDTVEVAFKLTMIENMMVDFGFRMWTNSDITEKKQISLYGNYKMDAMTFHLSAQYDMNEDDAGYYFGAGLDYSLDGGVGINADVRYTNDIKAGGKDAVVTAFGGVTKGFSNGLIGAGVEIKSAGDTGYSVPVRMEYWF